MKAVVAAFNQEKALVGAFSVIVKTDGSSAALVVTGGCLVPGADTVAVFSLGKIITMGEWKHEVGQKL